MAAPKADPPRCDVYGCGQFATVCTDGSEVDSQDLKRPAIKNLNLCDRHPNWAHSTDAQVFSMGETYRGRK